MSSLGVAFYEWGQDNLSVGTRLHPSRLPQGATLPALVYQLVPSEGPLVSQDGDTGVAVTRIQFDCWGHTWEDVDVLAQELRAKLSGFRGFWDDVYVAPCLLVGWPGFDDDDPKTGDHRRVIDALITHDEGADGS